MREFMNLFVFGEFDPWPSERSRRDLIVRVNHATYAREKEQLDLNYCLLASSTISALIGYFMRDYDNDAP